MTEVSLMMVTYNRLNLTIQTLKSIENNTNINYNLIVIDNGSTDGTVDFLKNYEPKENCTFKYLLNEKNKGIAVGRNQALKVAVELGSKWLCTIDNDVEVPPGWLEEAISIMDANPIFAMVGVNMEGVKYPLVTYNNITFQEKPQGNLGTACIVFPAKLQKMLGYFSTEYGLYGEEDADYGMRARVCKFKLGYIKEMGVHLGIDAEDVGEYREFKTECHKNNLKKFQENCALYYRGLKPLYIPYKD